MKQLTQALSPGLREIEGRAEVIPFCCAKTMEIRPGQEPEYSGQTEVPWDCQAPMIVAGMEGFYHMLKALGADDLEHVYIDRYGEFWPESSLMYVSDEGVKTLRLMIEAEREEGQGR